MASSTSDFAQYCCTLLDSTGPCIAKRMFGGWGISTGGLTLAIVADLGAGETLWLKADADTRSLFEAATCVRFTYDVKGQPKSMNYYSTPEDALESPELMRPWARLALETALRAAAGKPAKAAKTVKLPKAKASKRTTKPTT